MKSLTQLMYLKIAAIIILLSMAFVGSSSQKHLTTDLKRPSVFSLAEFHNILIESNINLIWLGEIHGINETNDMILQFFNQYNYPVKLFVEWADIHQKNINQYLIDKDCNSISWIDSVHQDGRYSLSMINLLDSISNRRNILVYCYDVQNNSELNRDSMMARNILKYISSDTLSIILSGNVHNVIDDEYSISNFKSKSAYSYLKSMSSNRLHSLSINQIIGSGYAWSCINDTCGNQYFKHQSDVKNQLHQNSSFCYFFPEKDSTYPWDGFIYLDTVTPSRPWSTIICKP